jgi:D-alanyl-D-alanine carboxypeptidase
MHWAWLGMGAALALVVGCGSEPAAPPPVGTGGASTSASGGGMGGAGGHGGETTGAGGEAESCAALVQDLETAMALAQDMVDAPGGHVMAVVTPICDPWLGAVGAELEPDSLVRIGSITKTYLAVEVLTLVDAGMLSLDDTLDTWVADVENNDTITLRQLLNHTAGVFNYTEFQPFVNAALANPEVEIEPQVMVNVAIDQGADFPPGTDFHYSNTGFILLGMIVEAVTASTLGEVFLDGSFATAELTRTFFDGEHALPEDVVPGYAVNGDDVTYAVNPSTVWAAGSMVADVEDVARWTTRLHRGEVLSDERLDDMRTVVPTGMNGQAYGLGMFRLSPPFSPVRGFGHSGAIYGYLSHAYYFPPLESTIVVVTTSLARNPNAAMLGALEAIEDALP